jgi:hypothetical protein
VDAPLGHGIVEQRFVAEGAGDGARIDDRGAGFDLLDRGLRNVEIAVESGPHVGVQTRDS